MSIIIDTNVFASNPFNKPEFKPIKEWLFKGTGKIVVGGTTYAREVIEKKYGGFVVELKKINKCITEKTDEVDKKEKDAKRKLTDADFNDPHLVALMLVSGCRLIYSYDKKSYPFLKHDIFFPTNKPRIYKSIRNLYLIPDTKITGKYKKYLKKKNYGQ